MCGSVVSVEQEIDQVFSATPHVVILGAGASRAALPNGDANGRRPPVMADFLDVVPKVKGYFTQAGIQVDEEGFEEAYSRIAENPAHSKLASKIEKAVYDYFGSLVFPPTPTLYDRISWWGLSQSSM